MCMLVGAKYQVESTADVFAAPVVWTPALPVITAKGPITVVGGFRYVTVVVPTWATLVEADPSPAVVTDVSLRAAIAATGLAWRVRDTAAQVEMLLLPPGTFMMGCTASNQNALPRKFCALWDALPRQEGLRWKRAAWR